MCSYWHSILIFLNSTVQFPRKLTACVKEVGSLASWQSCTTLQQYEIHSCLQIFQTYYLKRDLSLSLPCLYCLIYTDTNIVSKVTEISDTVFSRFSLLVILKSIVTPKDFTLFHFCQQSVSRFIASIPICLKYSNNIIDFSLSVLKPCNFSFLYYSCIGLGK